MWYTNKLTYNMKQTNNNKKKSEHKHTLICFNPPDSKNLKTNIAKHFLSLIDCHFPREHKYHTIFNQNNVKISYTLSVKSVIWAHREVWPHEQCQKSLKSN